MTPLQSSAYLTEASKLVMERALREALQLGHSHIGPEHIMLAILRDGDNLISKEVFKGQQATIRQWILKAMQQNVIQDHSPNARLHDLELKVRLFGDAIERLERSVERIRGTNL